MAVRILKQNGRYTEGQIRSAVESRKSNAGNGNVGESDMQLTPLAKRVIDLA